MRQLGEGTDGAPCDSWAREQAVLHHRAAPHQAAIRPAATTSWKVFLLRCERR
jgi:hypothetical protein